jgi:hypothetical protein
VVGVGAVKIMNSKFPIFNFKGQSGQALMIAILFATILFTIGLSITDLTTKDAKVSKLEEDESRARAAAEAGIEAAVGQGSNDDIDIGALFEGSGLSGDAVFSTDTSPEFTTPLISKDAQYTFYLKGYDVDNKQIITGSFDDDISVERVGPTGDYCSGAQAFAVELTLIDATPVTGGIVDRYIIDECDLIESDTDQFDFGDSLPTSSVTPDPHIVIARVIAPNNAFDGAQLKFVNEGDNDFPTQGRTITSTASVGASENQNVTKKVRLFQSHPQYPAEFFVTSM